jgi:NADPH:quinone reductase-like Zn-dependent oxidoreductase
VTEDLDVQPGERVLITAGAGGTGVFAIQLASARGAEVITTASEGNRAFCESLGATDVVDYAREDVEEAIRSRHPEGVDALLECVGGRNFDRSIRAVRRGGRAAGLVDEPPRGAYRRESG